MHRYFLCSGQLSFCCISLARVITACVGITIYISSHFDSDASAVMGVCAVALQSKSFTAASAGITQRILHCNTQGQSLVTAEVLGWVGESILKDFFASSADRVFDMHIQPGPGGRFRKVLDEFQKLKLRLGASSCDRTPK